MKRKLFLIFIFLNLLFVLAGCGNDPYVIERQYWYLQKKAKKIFVNPEATPNRQVNKIVRELNNFAKKYPNSTLEVSAEFSIASIFIVKKEYASARKQLQLMLNKYKNAPNICSEAVFLMGNTYELDGKWELALANYKRVMDKYPATKRGLDTPLYIAQYYKTKYQPDKMIEAFRNAAVHYDAISQSNPDTSLGYSTALLAVQAKLATKDIQGGIVTFNSIITNYKDTAMQASALMNIALIYISAKDNAQAKKTLNRLINNYPKSKILGNAKKLLEEINEK